MKTNKDTAIEIRERILNKQPIKLPIQAWDPVASYGKDYLYLGGGVSPDGATIYNYMGVAGKVDTIEVTEARASVHLYHDAYLDKLYVTDGEHSVAKGAYVAFFNVEGAAVVYIQGHVNTLHISSDAQVFLQEGAYVDFLHCSGGGFVRIDKGAAVHGLLILKDGKAVISTMAAVYYQQITEGAIVSHMPDNAVYPLAVRFHFTDINKRNEFCRMVTAEVKEHNGLDIDRSLTLRGICNCYVLSDGEWKGWNVYLSSGTEPMEDHAAIQQRISNKFGIEDVEVWIYGVSIADIEAHEAAERATQWCDKYKQYTEMQRQVEELRKELFPEQSDNQEDAQTHE
jgi:hypothetical protein